MLLDTMCNTFGGICFITLMVAIISVTLPKSDDSSNENNDVIEEMVINKKLERLIRERDELKSAIEIQNSFFEEYTSKTNIVNSLEHLTSVVSSNSYEIAKMKKEKERLEEELVKINTDISVNEIEVLRMKRLLNELEGNINEVKNKKNRIVRTPVERQLYGYSSVDVWINKNKMYCLDNRSHVFVKEDYINGLKQWEYKFNFNSGYTLNEDFFDSLEFKQLLTSIRRKMYIRIYSDTCSFVNLCRLRDKLIESHKMYNWHIIDNDILYFSEGYDGHVQ